MKKQIMATVLMAAIVLTGCQTPNSQETDMLKQNDKVEESVQVAGREAKSVTATQEEQEESLKGAGKAVSASAKIEEKESKKVAEAEKPAEESVTDSTEATQPKSEDTTVKAEQSSSSSSSQVKQEAKKEVKQVAKQETKKESKPAKKEAPAPKEEAKAPVKEVVQPKPEPEPEPEPENVYTPRKAASQSQSNALIQELRGLTRYNLQFIPTSSGDYWGDYGDVIVRAGWEQQWWGENALTRDEVYDAYNVLTSHLNSKGYRNYGRPYETDYDSFVNASGKRYRASLIDYSGEFEIHIILN